MSVIFIPKRSYTPEDFLFSQQQVIVNPVNTAGVMGKGLALALKETYPECFDAYLTHLFVSKTLKIGSPVIVDINSQIVREGGFVRGGEILDQKMCLFPTKEDWRKPSRNDYIDYGLLGLCKKYADRKYHGIAIPALGCGLGGLKWDMVKLIIKSHASELEKIFGTVAIYEP